MIHQETRSALSVKLIQPRSWKELSIVVSQRFGENMFYSIVMFHI